MTLSKAQLNNWVGGPPVKTRGPNGEEILVTPVPILDMEGKSRPGTGYSVFVDGRLAMMKTFHHLGTGNQRRLTSSRSVLFDNSGAISLVVDQDLKGLRLDGTTPPGMLSSLLGFASRCQLSDLFKPTPLHAAVLQEADGTLWGECGDEAEDLAAAVSQEGLAIVALSAFSASCLSFPSGLGCGGAALALSVYAAAVFNTVLQRAQLEACVAAYEPPEDDPDALNMPTVYATDSGSNDNGCFFRYWYRSYDGGLNWQFWYAEIVCAEGESDG